MKKAAHFLLLPELVCSPPNEAIVFALQELGYQVHLYAPGGDFGIADYGSGVHSQYVEYGKRWIFRNFFSMKWLDYQLFSGTTEDPMAIAGLLSSFYRRPSFTLADEIRSGSYAGNRSAKWKSLCRWGMRQTSLTVVNDSSRIDLQRDYGSLPEDHPFIVYPGCYRKPPRALDRYAFRTERGIPQESLVICYSGIFSEANGGIWFINAIEKVKDVRFYGQLVGVDRMTREILAQLRGAERLYIEPHRMPWKEAWAAMGGVDIGIAIYLQDGPQFQKMGTSSNRLCMFLTMGVPVIASRQPSFKFIEDYDCGVLVENQVEFIEAINRMRVRLDEMKKNALRCAREYIDAPGKYEKLKEAISKL